MKKSEVSRLAQVHLAVDALNQAFEADPSAIWTLFNAYTPCNEALADHPTVQVIEKDVPTEVEGQTEKRFTVGPLGLINGVIEAALGERICIKTSEPDENGKRKL